MNILIAGYGFVGHAHKKLLSETHSVRIYDPHKNYPWTDNPVDACIISVSTPPADDGSCDVSNVCDVISLLSEMTPILIKSTLSLEGWRKIKFMYPNHLIAFSPEFLRAATADEDFYNTREIYMGGDRKSFWHTLFSIAFNDDKFTITHVDVEELILTKCFRNAYLATKVSFFNQIHDLCEATGVNANMVLHLVGEDPRIGSSHTEVTEHRGFGGHCFPKDTSAIIKTGEKYNIDLTLIRNAVKYNKSIRRD